jgi:hypothetical protein
MKPDHTLAAPDIVQARATLLAPHRPELRRMHARLGALAETLETGFATCPCCGGKRYHNWPEKLLHEEITRAQQVVGRLLRDRSQED